jgi:uncharacterized Rossmann fold enzyme
MPMLYEDWRPIYEAIIKDFGYDEQSDENSARLLKLLTINSDLISDDEIIIHEDVTVFGNSGNLDRDIGSTAPRGTLIASGSAVGRIAELGIVPDIVVTDLDGDILPQIEASVNGAVTFIHAHGDNTEQIQKYANKFIGPIVLTTQSRPDSTVSNYGGFTDGDRAVCIARHFGAKNILLLGFDFEKPSKKEGSDPCTKIRKLQWAKRIIFDRDDEGVSVIMPR